MIKGIKIHSALCGLFCHLLTGCESTFTSDAVIPTALTARTNLGVTLSSLTSQALTVTGIYPDSGPTSGGTPVTLTGAGFTPNSTLTVSIGGSSCTPVNFFSSTILSCITSSNSSGTHTVTVSDATRTATLPNATQIYSLGFMYIPPAPTLVLYSGDCPSTPGSTTSTVCPISGGAVFSSTTSIRIAGYNFVSGATARIGEQTCSSPSVDTSTTPNILTCTAPAYPITSEWVDISVTNPDGQTVTSKTAPFYYSNIVYSTNPASYTANSAITSNTPTLSGASSATYTIRPTLPTGLSLASGTGIISGTPTATSSSRVYTITATSTASVDKVYLTLEVVP